MQKLKIELSAGSVSYDRNTNILKTMNIIQNPESNFRNCRKIVGIKKTLSERKPYVLPDGYQIRRKVNLCNNLVKPSVECPISREARVLVASWSVRLQRRFGVNRNFSLKGLRV